MDIEYAIKILRSEIAEPYTGDYSAEDRWQAIMLAVEIMEELRSDDLHENGQSN